MGVITITYLTHPDWIKLIHDCERGPRVTLDNGNNIKMLIIVSVLFFRYIWEVIPVPGITQF